MSQQKPSELELRVQSFSSELNQVLSARDNNRPTSVWGDPRAVVAHLRQGVSGQEAARTKMLPYLAPFLSPDDAPAWVKARDEWFFVVASHSKPSPTGSATEKRPNLGQAARPLRGVSASCEARFANLLACDESEVARRLREIVAILSAKELPVHWGQLLRDLTLSGWNAPGRPVQNSWARGFYFRPMPDQPNSEAPESA